MPRRSAPQLRSDALRIWQAGVDAVRPEQLFADQALVVNNELHVGDASIPLPTNGRIVVVGGGKAGAGMVRGLEASLQKPLLEGGRLSGIVSVPANCVCLTSAIELVAGRPAGVNEPRPEAAAATTRMLELVGSLTPEDLCICLISGGGSALMTAPIEGVSVESKARLTRLLAGAGATIEQLNTVRAAISRVKGGGLLRACRAGRMLSVIISDVLGDPLEVIASGPTVQTERDPIAAIRVLEKLGVADHPDARGVTRVLQDLPMESPGQPACSVEHVILANNATAVDAAGVMAESLGYNHAMDCPRASEGPAEGVGIRLAHLAQRMRTEPGPDCLITGGEPTVKLAVPKVRGRGGRNQQLALAALLEIGDSEGIAILSGGTDGEDGPTDAAGAIVDADVAATARGLAAPAAEYLARNDAYPFFEATDGLIITGPTHTNVCDVRVVCVDRVDRE